MKKRVLIVFAILAVGVAAFIAIAQNKRFQDILSGYQEVPAVSSTGSGDFNLRIAKNEESIDYDLTYMALEGEITQAHIHFGQEGVNGGIVLFLCTNLGNGPAGTQACPPPPATISGTLTAEDVVAAASAQGISAGEFSEVISAIRAGKTYVNVHTTKHAGGEIRSQIEPGRGQHH